MSDFPLALPPVVGKGDLDEWLLYLIENKGSDLFLHSGKPVQAMIKKKIVRLSQREISAKELKIIGEAIYGDDITPILSDKRPIDCSYTIPKALAKESQGIRAGGVIRDESELERFRVSITNVYQATGYAVKVVIRPMESEIPNYSQLGLDESLVKRVAETTQGAFLLVGATGSGKSTSIASILSYMVQREDSNQHVLTIEHPLEYSLTPYLSDSSIYTPREVGKNVNSFAEGLRDALRQHPTTVLVGEIRDQETAEAAINVSLSGHLLLGTLHANSIDTAISRLVNLADPKYKGEAKMNWATTIQGIIAQQLVSTTDGGVVAIREELFFDDDCRMEMLKAQPDEINTVIKSLVKQKGMPMVEAAKRLFDQDIISSKTYSSIRNSYE